MSASANSVLVSRQKVSALFESVLDNTVSPRQAINRWPVVQGTDPSLDAAYQALLHVESDEDHQQADVFYLDVQLTLLMEMSTYLERGKPLPPQMLQAYSKAHQTGYYCEQTVLTRPIRSMVDFGVEAVRTARRIHQFGWDATFSPALTRWSQRLQKHTLRKKSPPTP